MAKPNYQYEKRQRELAKKAKKAEKAARKSSGQPDEDEPPNQALDAGLGDSQSAVTEAPGTIVPGEPAA